MKKILALSVATIILQCAPVSPVHADNHARYGYGGWHGHYYGGWYGYRGWGPRFYPPPVIYAPPPVYYPPPRVYYPPPAYYYPPPGWR